MTALFQPSVQGFLIRLQAALDTLPSKQPVVGSNPTGGVHLPQGFSAKHHQEHLLTTSTAAKGATLFQTLHPLREALATQMKRSTDAHAPVTLTVMDAVLLSRRLRPNFIPQNRTNAPCFPQAGFARLSDAET